jgi:predicted nucleotidyltransferase
MNTTSAKEVAKFSKDQLISLLKEFAECYTPENKLSTEMTALFIVQMEWGYSWLEARDSIFKSIKEEILDRIRQDKW